MLFNEVSVQIKKAIIILKIQIRPQIEIAETLNVAKTRIGYILNMKKMHWLYQQRPQKTFKVEDHRILS